ncbi:MAG: nickel pincer cofactor biosynthesis protein LarC [Dethiobacteria bacterium]
MDNKRIIYLDCYCGISGDMLLGALLDAGLELSALEEGLSLLGLDGYRLGMERVCRRGITGTSFIIESAEDTAERKYKDIVCIIGASRLPEEVKERALAVFYRLAAVEARIHGMALEDVAFHEIGALDSILDIVGSTLALHILGIDEIISSPLPLGRGMIEIGHGRVPLPAPATAALLAAGDVPVYGVETEGELVTPTGAALVTTLACGFGEIPDFTLESVGYGAGKNEYETPNYLRVLMGAACKMEPRYREKVNIIEANIDDLNPEITGYMMEKLFSEGALDVFFTPIQMKKNRPAVKLSIISPPALTGRLMDRIFLETTTLGCRVMEARKAALPRTVEEMDTPWGPVRFKIVNSKVQDTVITRCAPEYEDCLSIARREQIPLQEAYRKVEEFYHTAVKDKGE